MTSVNGAHPDKPVLFLQLPVTPDQSEARSLYPQVELGTVNKQKQKFKVFPMAYILLIKLNNCFWVFRDLSLHLDE